MRQEGLANMPGAPPAQRSACHRVCEYALRSLLELRAECSVS